MAAANAEVIKTEPEEKKGGSIEGGPQKPSFNRGGRGGGGGPGRFSDRGRGRGGGRGGGGDRGERRFNDRNNQEGGGDQKNDQSNFERRKRGPGGPNGQHEGGGGGGYKGDRGDRGDRPNYERGMNDKFNERMSMMSGPTYDIPPVESAEKKFSGRNRLYIGNIAEVSEEELTEAFKPFGEVSEIFLNKEKNFGFIKVDYHSNAEKAKRELDGTQLKGRVIKLRFAPNSTTVKVKNLTPFVSNELLHFGFSVFGEIERAMVCVDERGKPTGEGIIDFARKGSAMHAIRKCSDGCFFLTGSLRPCIVEPYDVVDDMDGYPDKNINRKIPGYQKERDMGPRFALPGSFEFEYGMRWKQLHELFHQKELALKKELENEREKLEAQMEYAKYEHETEILREQLRAREMDRDRQKREWEMKERQADEQRVRNEEHMRRQQEEMESRMLHQEEELRRRQQENNLFMQAHNLDSMLDQQEQTYDSPTYNNSSNDHSGPLEPSAFMSSYERNHNRYEGRDNSSHPRGGSGRGGSGGGGGHWVSDNRRDDFPNKRRRF